MEILIIALVLLVLVVLLVVGVPVPFSFGGAVIVLVMIFGYAPSALMSTSYSKLASVTLLAIPMFILAGGIMEKGKIGKALIDWVDIFVGRIKGGLCIVTVITSAIFGSICGSGAATLSCIGSIIAPQGKERKYPMGVMAAVACCAAPLGLLIPPSAAQILIAWTLNISVLACFLSTIVPGVILTILLSLGSWILMRKEEGVLYEASRTPAQWGSEFLKRTKMAVPSLLMPVIILGGIYSGAMTATESAGVAVIYAIPVAMFVYKKLKPRDLLNTLAETATTTGVIMVMIGVVCMLSRILTQQNIPQLVSDTLMSISDNKYVILLMMNLFLVLIGMVMDDTSGTLLAAPILFPIAIEIGISPYHFAAIMGVNLGMGNITPPSAPFIYLSARIYNVQASEVLKPTAFLLLFAYLPTLILVTYWPAVSLTLPKLLLGTAFV